MGVCVVTGGSRGIGAAVARAVAADGHDVLLTYNADEHAARRVVDELPTRAAAYQADVGDPDQIEGIFAAATELGDVTALVNNAGVIADSQRVEDFTAERIRRVLDVNVVGLLLCCKHFLALGTAEAIVNISSRAAQRGGAGTYVDYAASKAAVETITVGLAQEVGPRVRVNAVSPGIIATEIHRNQAALGERTTGSPIPRPGQPEEVAAAVRWLLSPAASYVTGAVLPVSGGR